MAATTAVSGKHWLKPPLVQAPNPDNRAETVTYQISESYLYALVGISRLTPIFQMWTHVVGELPPINNISKLERVPVKPTLTTLADSVACFRGVKRPYDDEEDGESILVYVLNPLVTIERDEPNLVCLARAIKAPAGTALTVQVKPLKSLQNGAKHIHTGVVTRLETVTAEGNPQLPSRSDTRYQQRLW